MVWRVATLNDRPLATCLWLLHRENAVYVDGASSHDKAHTGINHMLIARVLSELHERGVRHFDFGAGPGGATSGGLARFKKGWGAHEVEHTELIARRSWYQLIRKLF